MSKSIRFMYIYIVEYPWYVNALYFVCINRTRRK